MAKKNPEIELKGHIPVYGPKQNKTSLSDILGGIAVIFIGLLIVAQCAG
ncbi:hypothetical protein [Citromicrobium bathyomarinum]|nr:hypothetical protein [Citromicrobium bathyomarinum]MCD1624020.1 hypothetical protein [Citromicrobium bathyomarinum]